MKLKTAFYLLIIVVLGNLLITGCAGTREEDSSAFSGETSDPDDLDDIEKLLGIKDESSKPATQTKKNSQDDGERLDLLNTNEFASQKTASQNKASLTPAEKKSYEDKIDNLQTQLDVKNREINRLNNQLSSQQSEINTSASQSRNTYGITVSEINTSEYKSRYDQARDAFESRNYDLAIQYFESLLEASNTHSLSDNAQYWIGECHYALRQYDPAIIDFEKVLTFSNSNKKADAQFKLGLCYLQKGDKTKALEEFDRLQADYPDSPYNARAQTILSKY